MKRQHTLPAKLIHWGFIVLYAYGLLKQIDDLSQLEDKALLLFEVVFACAFLVIVLMRYFYMRRFETFQGASIPVPKAHKILAKTVHSLMYMCLILLPLTGLMIAGLYTRGYTNEEEILLGSVLGLHSFSAGFSLILIAIHIAAAVWSRIKGDGVRSSMVPIWNDEEPTTNPTILKIVAVEDRAYEKIEEMISSRKN
ncbi:MAG: cytochrome b/b6 domain-containing protein [Euryarchaeota archaeon]|nr:cytochrome b/b6 domain-containing protein [Euryarchaeota archaeon]